jgi:uncharacterized damage-inducible protein DinB
MSEWTPPTSPNPPAKAEGNGIAQAFLDNSVWQLRVAHWPKIKEAVERLSEEQIWERPNSESNSIGNLLLHLEGNVRQHIISGVGRVPDTRKRSEEFATTGGKTKQELLAHLEKCVNEACAVLENADPKILLEKRVIQGREVLLLNDIYHVVEHFSYHTGQIIWMVKAVTGRGFDWYRKLDRT